MSSGALLNIADKKLRKPAILKVLVLCETRVLVDRRTGPRRYQLRESARLFFETSFVLSIPESGLGGLLVTATVGAIVLIAGLRVINRWRL